MLCNHSFIPSQIVFELNDIKTKLVINKGWELIYTDDKMIELFHEKYGIVKAHRHENEPRFFFINTIFKNGNVIINEYLNKIKIFNSRNELVELWNQGLFHIFFEEKDIGKINSRYKWFFETLLKYSNSKLTPYDMFQNLNNGKVAVIGIGGVGSSLAVLLSSHGVNNITLIDGDSIEESNLTRQIFFTYENIGENKTAVLARHIKANNPDANISKITDFIKSYDDAEKFLSGHQFVVLCADEPRFKIKAWVGKFCFSHNIPLLIMTDKWIGPILVPHKSPCYGCLGRYHTSKLENVQAALFLNKNQLPPRASFGPEPMIVAGYLSSLVLLYLSKIDQETFLNKRLMLNLFGIGKEEIIPRYTDCKICKSR